MIPFLIAGAGAILATKVIHNLISNEIDDDAPRSHHDISPINHQHKERQIQQQLDHQLQQQALDQTQALLKDYLSHSYQERQRLIDQLIEQLNHAIEQQQTPAIEGILQLLTQIHQHNPIPQLQQLINDNPISPNPKALKQALVYQG